MANLFWLEVVEVGASNAQAFYQFSRNTEMSSRRSRVMCPHLRHAARFARPPNDRCFVVSLIMPMVPIGGKCTTQVAVFADHCCCSYEIYFLASTDAATLILLVCIGSIRPNLDVINEQFFSPTSCSWSGTMSISKMPPAARGLWVICISRELLHDIPVLALGICPPKVLALCNNCYEILGLASGRSMSGPVWPHAPITSPSDMFPFQASR